MTAMDRSLRRFFAYALVGGAGTTAHYGLFLGLLSLTAPVLLASCAGYVLGAVVNYWLNRSVTFASQHPHREAAPRFLAVAAFGLVLNLSIVTLLVGWARWQPLSAQIAATAFCLFATYALNARWSFATAIGQPKT
ncbi:Putative flippase GtrA (transmembrane translocase of bactoprenol-linked glucose) [Aureimonas phyllosphaerae]|uniref:Putative flippase GtrA n=2 Tax=Aureimonas phyllosphaerae TaxID=1166078 RepID=A0A7W6BTG0_9HYPH|nr:putative flippase GtrA [Aureimonas phyllosphaerae]MBB3958409.1 putative flippase GtrA [Aureimonas phyllosphaerae]SFE96581.1 Putative flippase GtrA (transmembrane translocase of bactoprenol-linked glucose) [Aureimonas phyllosphaerae]